MPRFLQRTVAWPPECSKPIAPCRLPPGVSWNSGGYFGCDPVDFYSKVFHSWPKTQIVLRPYRIKNRSIFRFLLKLIKLKPRVVVLVKRIADIYLWTALARICGAERVIAIDRLTPSERQRLIRTNQSEDKEKSSLYDAFDVFALPSTGESLPYPTLKRGCAKTCDWRQDGIHPMRNRGWRRWITC